MNSNIIDVNESDFENKVLEESSNKLVVVDFWAPWCGPCKQLTPILEKVISASPDKIILAKINIDENPQTPQKFGVRGIPTLMFFKEGKLIESKVGSLPKTALEAWIQANL